MGFESKYFVYTYIKGDYFFGKRDGQEQLIQQLLHPRVWNQLGKWGGENSLGAPKLELSPKWWKITNKRIIPFTVNQLPTKQLDKSSDLQKEAMEFYKKIQKHNDKKETRFKAKECDRPSIGCKSTVYFSEGKLHLCKTEGRCPYYEQNTGHCSRSQCSNKNKRLNTCTANGNCPFCRKPLTDVRIKKQFTPFVNDSDSPEHGYDSLVWRRKSKASLAMLTDPDYPYITIHFSLAGIDFASVTKARDQKDPFLDRRITESELRWVFRYRNVDSVKKRIQFWRIGEKNEIQSIEDNKKNSWYMRGKHVQIPTVPPWDKNYQGGLGHPKLNGKDKQQWGNYMPNIEKDDKDYQEALEALWKATSRKHK